MPNKENLRKWVDALRSGEYQQGYDRLATRGVNGHWRYCCLGVACEVAIKDGLDLAVKETTWAGEPASKKWYGKEVAYISLPSEVFQWLGFGAEAARHDALDVDSPDPGRSFSMEKVSLTALNDSWRLDFQGIATAIENTFLKEDDSVA